MTHDQRLAASCRMALAALLHDVGKFAERAGLDSGTEALETHLQLYARRQDADGRHWYTHRHAACTALAIDRMEPWLPALVGTDMFPFTAWKDADADDSLINAAALHHKPATFLQWIIATADRVASGFERETFDQYNNGQETTTTRRNHITARQLTLFEQIHPGSGKAAEKALTMRYPLLPLSPCNLFPIDASTAETDQQETARQEYRELWDGFLEALRAIPSSHRARLDLWLDHFETLWLTFTHAIPSATAFGARPEVSLHDHSRAVAALAVALWRYHHERADDPATVVRAQQHRADWEEPKLLLIQGDLFGIQEFIFASGGETNRRAARLLRGRSFQVGLLSECAAMRILDALSLPATSQIINAAGKFLIVAPNTESTLSALAEVRAGIDAWFLEHSHGQSGVGLAWLPASCNDFLADPGHPDSRDRFRTLMKRLFSQLEQARAQRFGLCTQTSPPALFSGFLDRFDNTRGVCQIDGRSPAVTDISEAGRTIQIGKLARDQIDLGNWLTRYERLLVSRETILAGRTLKIDLFGYRIGFTGSEDDSGRFGAEVGSGNLLRAWDFSLPGEDGKRPLWNGYARRAINAYVPRFDGSEAENAWQCEKYADCEPGDVFDPAPNEPKTFNHLACEDLRCDAGNRWVGIEALTTLKGDVDNLGLIFQQGLETPTFAKIAALSRQMNAFFALYLPWLCRTRFRNAYTVFAGGDDFFLIGPWKSQLDLARTLRADFRRYVAGNPDIHFSAGLSTTKPGLPVRHLAELGEQALDDAKSSRPEKDSVTCYGQTVPWATFDQLDEAGTELQHLSEELGLSARYLYGLLELVDKAERFQDPQQSRPEDAIWRSQFAYRTFRMLEQTSGLRGSGRDAERRRRAQQLAQIIADLGIERFGGAYRIPLFTHLYQTRD